MESTPKAISELYILSCETSDYEGTFTEIIGVFTSVKNAIERSSSHAEEVINDSCAVNSLENCCYVIEKYIVDSDVPGVEEMVIGYTYNKETNNIRRNE